MMAEPVSQSHAALKINAIKAITGEKSRSVALTKEDAAWTLRFLLLQVFGFMPEQLEFFVDRNFLVEYKLNRFARMIPFPISDRRLKQQYLLHLICPEYYDVDLPQTALDQYVYTLGHPTREYWEMKHDYQGSSDAVQWVIQNLFDEPDCASVMAFTEKNPKAVVSLFRAMRLGSFYDDVYAARTDGVLDMVFFSYPIDIQRKNFRLWADYRIPKTDDLEFEIITTGQEQFYEKENR